MLSNWSAWFRREPKPGREETVELAPDRLCAPGVDDFIVAPALRWPHGLPLLDWEAAGRWVQGDGDPDARAGRWGDLERAWLLHLRDALGPSYALRRQQDVLLLSALPQRQAELLIDFVRRSRERVLRLLDGLGQTSSEGFEILVVFEDEESYYRYTSGYDDRDGEFGRSGGMYIDGGCGHFVTTRAELQSIEPVVVHELTHACLGHLPLPLWLNEGLAVNTEQRLSPVAGAPAAPSLSRHRAYWTPERLQAFWSGSSFSVVDEGQELSYDLARLLVAEFAADDWPRMRRFVQASQADDAGQAAALQHLGLDLGAALAALLDMDADACRPFPENCKQA